MRTKPSKATLLALGAALLGVGCLHVYLARYEHEVAGGAQHSVLVLTRDLAPGTVISRAALDYRDLPERYLEERHIEGRDLARVLGARASTALASGSTLLWSDLESARADHSLAGLVRVGMRAYALAARELRFDGLLRPGDRVDVLFTPPGSGTRTLLQNVLVLTVGGELTRDLGEDHRSPREGAAITLSLALEQAQQLAQSEGQGALRLVLRNPQDFSLVDGTHEVVSTPRTSREDSSLAALSERGAP
jgi:pilus assembly protein CpaB